MGINHVFKVYQCLFYLILVVCSLRPNPEVRLEVGLRLIT